MQSTQMIVTCSICYCFLFAFTWLARLYKSNRLFTEGGVPARNMPLLLASHMAGICCLAFVPFYLIGWPAFSIVSSSITIEKILFPTPGLIVVFLVGLHTGSQIRIRQSHVRFSLPFTCSYFAIRLVFICAYELFFRGFLLFNGLLIFGIVKAITISTGLTILLHLFTNKKEMWACIPFGIMQCMCCFHLNAVWPAMVIHMTLSLAYEASAVKYLNNNLKLVK